MPKVKEIIPMVALLIVTFYFVYPQALSVMGSSFALLGGGLGIVLYAYNRFPFKEVLYIMIGLFVIFFWFFTVGMLNNSADTYIMGYPKSQIAWFFTAYLVIFGLYKVHKNPSFNTFLLYIALCITLQSAIAFAMYLNEGISDFFTSIQLHGASSEEMIEEASTQRLVGYGIAFFGAGAMNGLGLIVISYLMMKMKLSGIQYILFTGMYVFVFYIGLFMARTTIVGMAVGFILIAALYLKDNRAQKKQAKKFILTSVFLMFAGYTFAMFYFSSFADWAFELFNNIFVHGTVQTRSSSGLEEMFLIPEDMFTLFFGNGIMAFWGSDVGYTRMLFFVGIIGTLIFFGYQIFLINLSKTKDWGINLFLYTIFIYVLGLNVKGWIDMNFIFYAIFFYFMFHKYYVYIPNKKRLMLQSNNISHFKNPALRTRN